MDKEDMQSLLDELTSSQSPHGGDRLSFNGVNGTTGEYGMPEMSGDQLAQLLRGETQPENLNELRFRHEHKGQADFGAREGVDPKRLDQSGWGVIFAHDADPAVRDALAPLLLLRQEQAGERFQIYDGVDGYRKREAKNKFLARHGAGPGPADPEKVPYYLLLVGEPATIPYRFQTQLDVQYAVGRIAFDTVEEYANYAASVVATESGKVQLPRQVSFFGVANDQDKATLLSSQHLVAPLHEYLRDKRPDWQLHALVKEQATKANLASLLGGEDTPALLFTASHGMEFRQDDSRQLPHQGALLCQDWPGPQAWRGKGSIPQDFYFAGDDLASDAGLLGLIGFFFACYGAGTPHYDEFAKQAFKDSRREIAPHPFLAGLPTRMLSHSRGGALAVIGHVERAWGYSFVWQSAGAQTAVFESTLDRLLDGHPVGSALEYFDDRYAELATELADQLEEIELGAAADPYEMAGTWTANNDARGYVVLGDPAVRMPVSAAVDAPVSRPSLDMISVASGKAPGPVSSPTATAVQTSDETVGAESLHEDLAVAFGLRDQLTELSGSIRNLTTQLATALKEAAADITSLEIKTFVVDDLDEAQGDESKARLQALTHIELHGDTQTYMPAKDGDIDEGLWQVHIEMVKEAQANRAQFLGAMAEMAAKLLKSFV